MSKEFPKDNIWDHPRMRGEHLYGAKLNGVVLGSSPHARGTLFKHRPGAATAGIIPACAGNTFTGENEITDH